MKKTFIKTFTLLFISIIVGFLLLIGVYSLPIEKVKNHIIESQSLYVKEEEKIDNWIGYLRYAKIDNYTDSLMMNTAICREYESKVFNAVLNPHYKLKEDVAKEFGNSNIGKYTISNNVSGVENYERYWHGYLIFLVPALMIYNVGGLRMIMLIVQFLLSMLLLYKVSKIDPIYMFAYAIAILFINPITTVLNFQNSDIFIMMLVFSIIILYFDNWLKEKDRYCLFFAFIGICTSYFDFLTYPLVSWGIPITTLFLINKDSLCEKIKKLIYYSLCWVVGYIGMWMGKWILVSLLTNKNGILDGINNVMNRSILSNAKEIDLSFGNALFVTLESINDPAMVSMGILSILVIVIYFLIRKEIPHFDLTHLSSIIPFFIILVSPFVWAFFVRNHYITHQFLEYRTMSIAILSFLIILINLFKQ